MAKLKSSIRKTKHSGRVSVEFKIPLSLAEWLENDELSIPQKIEMAKTYTDLLSDKSGNKMFSEMIPTQIAVILIMILEVQESEEQKS